MQNLEKEILNEASTLPKDYQDSVIHFIRFLKFQEVAKQHNIEVDKLLNLCLEEMEKQSVKDFQKSA